MNEPLIRIQQDRLRGVEARLADLRQARTRVERLGPRAIKDADKRIQALETEADRLRSALEALDHGRQP